MRRSSRRSRNGDRSNHKAAPVEGPTNRLSPELLDGAAPAASPQEQVGSTPPAEVADFREAFDAGQGTTNRPVLAVFCFEPPESLLGQTVAQTVASLVRRDVAVHVFARHTFEAPGARMHAVGESEGDLVEQAHVFGQRAAEAFQAQFPGSAEHVTPLGYEWSTVPALAALREARQLEVLLSLHSLERQRSDLSSPLSRQIEELELQGLREARTVLVQQQATGEVAKYWVPECADRLTNARQPFPVHLFPTELDPGQVKARYQIGPLDPIVVFVGDLEDRYGPQFLLKALPAILKNTPQARLVLIGDGSEQWPLRVFTRYMLLEHAVRLVGSLEGQPVFDLIAAADVVAVPSREQTPWWPILAAWAARRPVVATHFAAPALTEHERDAVLCYPSENSLVWGVERILYDQKLARDMAERGHEKLEARFGWNCVAEQLTELIAVQAAR